LDSIFKNSESGRITGRVGKIVKNVFRYLILQIYINFLLI